MEMHTKVSCIIPVYNEGPRVGAVIDTARNHPLIEEIIVINDGSTDNSKAILEKHPGIHFISYDKNHGKTFAVMTGIKQAKRNLLMLLDSDLTGLTPENLTDLITPVIHGRADMTISLRKNSLLVYKLMGLDYVSGERVFDRSIIGDLEALAHMPGFGLETYLNQQMIEKKLRLKVIKWPQVISLRKAKKAGWWEGTKADIGMVFQILSMVSVSGALKQMWDMRKLRVH